MKIFFYPIIFILLIYLTFSCKEEYKDQKITESKQSLDEMLDSVSKITGTEEQDSLDFGADDIFRDAIISTIELLDEEGFIITGDSVVTNVNIQERLNSVLEDNSDYKKDSLISKIKNIRHSVFMPPKFDLNQSEKLIFEQWTLSDTNVSRIITDLLEDKHKSVMRKFLLKHFIENEKIYILINSTDMRQKQLEKIWYTFLKNLGINIAEAE